MLNRWLDEGEGDGKIVRELDPLPNSSAATLALIRHKFLVVFHLSTIPSSLCEAHSKTCFSQGFVS